ncbi:MAG TPA: acyl-CoA dehydrogenase family protein [Kofleriaceae bacterium]|nr:acyl-CoA dehydrogenase family protein [Kofleriaceae bacterium]
MLARLFSSSPATAIQDLAAWRRAHQELTSGVASTVARALVAGAAADRPGWAFASGYAEALRHLVPSVGDRAVALAATEAGGAHPRAIETRLAPGPGGALQLDGDKRFVTLASICEAVIVIAREGEDAAGRPRLAAVIVPLAREGVEVRPLPPTPFAPEIPHCAVALRGVAVAPGERLPGDGYDDLLKPFRTVEDIHVVGAITGYLCAALSRAAAPPDHAEELATVAAALLALGAADPRAAATHRALGGALAALERALARAGPHLAGDAAWQRDRPILQVASKVRVARLEAARAKMAG